MPEDAKMTGPEFRLLQDPISLPVIFESLYASTLSDRLHVIGLNEARGTRHLSISGRGEVIAAAEELPLAEVTGVASCENSLIVAGVGSDNRPAALRIAADSHIESVWEIPSNGGQFRHWPRPVCVADAPWLLSITLGLHAALQLVPLAGRKLSAPAELALDDDCDAIDVLSGGSDVLLTRVHADCKRLELMRIAGQRVIARVDVEAMRPTAPSLACVNDRIVLAWVTEPGAPHLQWFDSGLVPLDDPEVLPPSPEGEVERVQLTAMAKGELAIFYSAVSVARDAEVVHKPDGTLMPREPLRMRPLWILAYDCTEHRIGPFRLVDGDAKLYTPVGIGGNVAVVHRGQETRLSLFTSKA